MHKVKRKEEKRRRIIRRTVRSNLCYPLAGLGLQEISTKCSPGQLSFWGGPVPVVNSDFPWHNSGPPQFVPHTRVCLHGFREPIKSLFLTLSPFEDSSPKFEIGTPLFSALAHSCTFASSFHRGFYGVPSLKSRASCTYHGGLGPCNQNFPSPRADKK